ncbi:hypothetical protein [Promicromonospora sp. NPDC019610]|uniref:hypothetical protein n=1 Tax=Promicromonospora sp. NPDC019610 TaxID=3364405 RepID=UPI003799F3DB
MNDEQVEPSKDEEPDIDENLPDRRPRPVDTRPKTAARNRLRTALTELGFDNDSAAAIVRAVDDPEQTLTQLRAPAEIGVHGGVLRVVATRIRTGSVIPIPTNPRVSSRISFPAGGEAPGGIDPLTMTQKDGSSATVNITAGSLGSLKDAMEVAREYISASNDLRASVKGQGVLLPVTVIPVTFDTNSDQSQTVVCTIDGSSRLTAVMSIWDLTSSEVLFELNTDVALGARRDPVLNLMERDVATLSSDELARLRTQSVPANLVVGFEAYEDGLDFPSILDAYLGLIHVEPPQPWGDAAGYDKRADAVLDELQRLKRITDEGHRYLAGLMSPDEAEKAGFDATLDGRAAAIFHDIDRSRNTRAVNRALRRIGMRDPKRDHRLEVATELAMRAYRRNVTDLVRRNPRMALPSAMQRLRSGDSWVPTLSTADELLEAALAELASDTDGPAGRELAVRAAFWLTRYNALQKSSRADTRFADQLLEHIRLSQHGVRVLHRAIVDARAGTHPRQTREDGSVAQAADGSDLPVDDGWLRRTFAVPEEPAPDDEPSDDDEPEWNARDELRSMIYAIRDDTETIAAKIEALDSIKEDGQPGPLVATEGVPADIADEIADRLDKSRTRIHVLKAAWDSRNDAGS